MTTTIDILIPAYNAARFIRTTLDSILAQTVRDLRVVIVDDGSTDETGAIADSFAAADPRVVVHHQPNRGIVDALNAGLELCTAEILGRIDADDIAHPDRFEQQIAFLRANPQVVAHASAARHIDADGKPTGSFARLASPDFADPWFVPCKEPYLMHPFLCVRRDAMRAIGGYRQVYYAEDTDLYWRLRGQGKLVNSDIVMGDYRLHATSISGSGIVNGRVMSISSQLTGISEQRRLTGRPDIEFPREAIGAYRAAGTLAKMVEIASGQLDDKERHWYGQAVAAKMLELTGYRPYDCDADDCRFIGDIARKGFGHLPADNQALLKRRIAGTAARIAAEGRVADAVSMLPASLYPSFAARYVSRTALPAPISAMLRRSDTKAMPVKGAPA